MSVKLSPANEEDDGCNDLAPTPETGHDLAGIRPALHDLLDRISDGLVALDTDWRYTFINRQAASLFGRTPADLIGRHIWTEFPEGVGQPFQLAYEKALAEQVVIQIENYYEPWDRWFENRIYPSPDGLSIFFHEISERKRVEALARENSALLELQNAVLKSIADGAKLHDTLDVLLRGVEAQGGGVLASILLLDEDGVTLRHAGAPSLPPRFVEGIDGHQIGPSAGSCGTAAFRRESVVVEDIATDPLWNDYRDDALAHGLRACWSTPICDADQDVLGTFALYFGQPCRPSDRHRRLIGISTHVAAVAIVKERETESLRINQDAIRRRDIQLVEAQRIAHLGSYEWDAASNVVHRSDELCRIFGVAADEFEPTFEGYLRRVHPEDRDHTRAIIEESFRQRTPFAFEERIVRPDGSIRLLSSQGKWMPAGGGLTRLVGICQDITERRRVEEQSRQAEALRSKNEELKAFAYTVSHDLKAPLRGIAGYARELERRHVAGIDDRGRFCLQQILTATQNLDQLIEDLLHYSRVDAQTPSLTDVALDSMVGSVLRDRHGALVEQGTVLIISVPAITIRTWESGLLLVLSNLIDNAVKYSRHSKPPRIQITAETQPDLVRIAIEDNGIGFNMNYRERIFGLFNRLVRQEQFEGTGAGLAIAKKVMDKLGGHVDVTSVEGIGTTFFIDVPCVPGALSTRS